MKRFNSFEAWVKYMNDNARGKWYIAGGYAAWMHIEHYANKDLGYYATQKDIIAPADIEIGIDRNAAENIKGSHTLHGGTQVQVLNRWINVDMQDEPTAEFSMALSRCSDLNMIKIHSVESIKISYERAGAGGKEQKRRIRLAMLKLISERRRIDAAGVSEKESAPRLAGQLMQAVSQRR